MNKNWNTLDYFEEKLAGQVIEIKVTKEDIENGLRGQICGCPIALAVNRALNFKSEWQYVTVCDDEITLFEYIAPPVPEYNGIGWYEIKQFINKFDNEELVFPFKFTIEF